MRELELIVIGAVAFISGCTTKSAASSPDAAVPVDDCTLTTVLTPGVPGSPGHLIPSERNPNGASELATLMRRMQTDMTLAREVILDGGAPPSMWSVHRKLRCSWPTAASDRDAKFDGFAQVYLAALKELDERKPSAAVAFDNTLSACHLCHDNSCPGPLVVIDALRIVPLDGGVVAPGR